MKHENEFGAKVAQYLRQASTDLSPKAAERLQAARRKAMDGYREPVRLFGLVPVTAGASYLRDGFRNHPLIWGPVLALAIAIAGYSALNSNDSEYSELGELDAAILSSDVPIRALVDQDIRSVLSSGQ